MAKRRQHRIRLALGRRSRPAGRQRRSRTRPRSGDSARRRRDRLCPSRPVRRAAARESRAARRQGPHRRATRAGRAHRRRRSGVAGRDARADRSLRHQRRAVAARPRRDDADQAAAAGGGSGGQDRREDGVPARVLHLSGDLGGDDRPGGHQVRPGARPHGDRNDDDDDRNARSTGLTRAVPARTGHAGRHRPWRRPGRASADEGALHRRSQRLDARRIACVCPTRFSSR